MEREYNLYSSLTLSIVDNHVLIDVAVVMRKLTSIMFKHTQLMLHSPIGREITAGQRTVSGQNEQLSGQTFA
jgi:hypothetical protein